MSTPSSSTSPSLEKPIIIENNNNKISISSSDVERVFSSGSSSSTQNDDFAAVAAAGKTNNKNTSSSSLSRATNINNDDENDDSQQQDQKQQQQQQSSSSSCVSFSFVIPDSGDVSPSFWTSSNPPPSSSSSSANKRRKRVHNPYSWCSNGNATPTASSSSSATRSHSTTTAAASATTADSMKVEIATHDNNIDFSCLAVDLPQGCTIRDLFHLLKGYDAQSVWMKGETRRAFVWFDPPLQGYIAYAALDGIQGFRFFPANQLIRSTPTTNGGEESPRPQFRFDYMSDELFYLTHIKARRQVGDGVVPSLKLNGMWNRFVHNASEENYGQFQFGRGLLTTTPPPSSDLLTPPPPPPPPRVPHPPTSPSMMLRSHGLFIDVYEARLREAGVIKGTRRRKDFFF